MTPAVLDPPHAAPFPPETAVKPELSWYPRDPVAGLRIDQLIERFGSLPAWRVLNDPAPGTATFEDAIDLLGRGHLCELIDGILLEKDVGLLEAEIAVNVSTAARNYLKRRKLGRVAGADGFLRLGPDQTRGPDTSIFCWKNLPGGRMPAGAVPAVPPTIAVEVISESNTEQEMNRKLRDYFGAGTQLAWYVYPVRREVRAFTAPAVFTTLTEAAGDVLTAEHLLPGFALPLSEIFDINEPPISDRPAAD